MLRGRVKLFFFFKEQLSILKKKKGGGASLVVQMVKNLPAMRETQVGSLQWEDLLEKERVYNTPTK